MQWRLAVIRRVGAIKKGCVPAGESPANVIVNATTTWRQRLSLAGPQTWEDTWLPDRREEWLHQLKAVKKHVQRTLNAAQKLCVTAGAELRRGQAIAEAPSGKLAAIIDLIFIPDKASMVDPVSGRK
jgi:hypothetical protein